VAGVLYGSIIGYPAAALHVASCLSFNNLPTPKEKLSPGAITTVSADKYSVGKESEKD